MRKSNTIYLSKALSSEDYYHSEFIKAVCEKYNIINYIKFLKFDIITPYIKYTCPNCEAKFDASWEIVHNVKLRLLELKNGDPNGIFDYYYKSKDGKKYVMLISDVTSDGVDIIETDRLSAIRYHSKDLPEMTPTKFSTINNLFENMKYSLKNDNLKTFEEIANIWNLKCCPICNNQLIRKYPFTEARLYIDQDFGHFKAREYWPQKLKSSVVSFIDYEKEKKDFLRSSPLFQRRITDEIKQERSNFAFENQFTTPFLKNANNFILKCDVQSSTNNTHIVQDKDFLKNYLSHLINLESNIIFMSQRLKDLYLLRGENDRDIAFESNFPVYESIQTIEHKIKGLNSKLETATQERNMIKNSSLSFREEKMPSQPQKPTLLKSHFFNKKKIEAQNAQLMDEYEEAMRQFDIKVIDTKEKNRLAKEKAMQERNRIMIEYNQTIDDYTQKIAFARNEIKKLRDEKKEYPSKSLGKKQMIDTEISLVEDALKESFKCRNEMYSYNIVFDKYRNIVALTTFYEYLMAGRCESLDGANGAYNIYENEIRLDAIITQLDEIKIKLDEIKQNQYMIYKTMKDIESSLKHLNASMDKAVKALESIDTKATTMNNYLANISQNSEVIAHNTAVSAYYSKKNAELTNALGFMVALK